MKFRASIHRDILTDRSKEMSVPSRKTTLHCNKLLLGTNSFVIFEILFGVPRPLRRTLRKLNIFNFVAAT